MPGIYS